MGEQTLAFLQVCTFRIALLIKLRQWTNAFSVAALVLPQIPRLSVITSRTSSINTGWNTDGHLKWPLQQISSAICAMLIRICSPLASSSLAGTRSRAARCTLCLLEALCLSDNMRLAVRVLRSFTVFATLTTRKE